MKPLLGCLGVDYEAVVNLHAVPLVGPVQDVHHVLLELLVLVPGGPEVRGGKVLMSNYFLICVRVLGVVLKVEEVVASE